MGKRVLCLLICLLLLCCALSSAGAEVLPGREKTSGEFVCVVQDDGTVMITGYTGQDAALVFPDTLDGIPVTAIGPSACQSNNAITEVVIPEGITSLGDSVFKRCTGLERITLPDSLTEIGVNPFAGCEALSEIILDDDDADGDGSWNKNLVYDEAQGVLFSRDDRRLVCYSGQDGASELEIPAGTRIIGAEAFYECDNIRKVRISRPEAEDGSALTAIGRRAFYGCGNLESINLEDTEISTIGSDAFFGCASLQKLTFPGKVTSIAERAFSGCDSLNEVNMPESITSIGEMAFRNCTDLVSI